MEQIGMKISLDSTLQIYYTFSIRTRSKNETSSKTAAE